MTRAAEQYLPYDGHVKNGVVRLKDGSLLAMGRLHGVPHELASRAARNAASRSLNTLWMNIADDNVTAYSHLIRRREVLDRPVPVFFNDFSAKYHAAIRECILNNVFQNSWFLSVVVAPRIVPVGTSKFRGDLMRLMQRLGLSGTMLDADIMQLEEIWHQLSQGLSDHRLERLRLRELPRVHWDFGPDLASEMAEALHTILTGGFEPKPLVSGPLGDVVYTDQTIFERRIHRVLPPGCDDDGYDGPGTRWGIIFGWRRYPKSTRPIIFDRILKLPMELVLSQSCAFLSQASSIARLTLKQDQMKAAGDAGRKERKQLRRAASEVGGDVVRAVHQFSLAVYADSYRDLIRNAGLARTELANTAAVVIPETTGNESAWWAQLPGNSFWRTRPAGISSRNWADLSHFGAFPVGARSGRWGDAMITFRTTADTAYDFIPHVGVGDDVGMTLIVGPTGAGKTVALGSLISMYDQSIGDDGIQFVFDKDRGLELLVRFMHGNYLQFRLGEPSGMAPLRGLSDTPADRLFLTRFVRSLILLDDLGPIPAEDYEKITYAVAAIMRKPIHLRSFAGLRQYLGGWGSSKRAGPRLERWCRAGELGWLFDGEEDHIDLQGRIANKVRLVGFDLTAILGMPDLVEVAGAYLIYLISLVTDGRRVVLSVDEAKFYIFHDIVRRWLEDQLGTGRKNELILNICAQQPEHLLKGDFGVMVVNQCKTKIALPNGDADEDVYRKKLYFTEGEYFAVHEGMHPKSHEFLIHRHQEGDVIESVVVRFDLSELPEQLAVLSGRQISVRRADALREIHGDQWEAEFTKEAAD